MDQDGNTVTPRTPNFSSPNIQSDDNQNPPVEQPTAVPMEPANPTITAAAAAMTDADPRTAITSAPSSATPPARGFFGTRFKAKQNAAASTTPSAFDGAPDFFKEAAAQNSDFIAVGEQPAQPRIVNKKALFLAILGLFIVAALAVVFCIIIPFINNSRIAKESKEIAEKINPYYVEDLNLLEEEIGKVPEGPEAKNNKITKFFAEDEYNLIKTRIENTQALSESLQQLDAGKYSDRFKDKLRIAQSKVKNASAKYNSLLDSYTQFYNYTKGKKSNVSEELAKIVNYDKSYKDVEAKIAEERCMGQTTFTPVCRQLIDQRKEAKAALNNANSSLVFGGDEAITDEIYATKELADLIGVLTEKIDDGGQQ